MTTVPCPPGYMHRKALPSSSAWIFPAGVNSPPHLSISTSEGSESLDVLASESWLATAISWPLAFLSAGSAQQTVIYNCTYAHTHTHVRARTHTHPFKGPFSGSVRVSWYQKGKTNLDFTQTRDSEWQWHTGIISLLQTDNHTSTPPLCFLQAGCPSCRPTNSVKALKHWSI